MWKVRKIKGSASAESYKNGWELALSRFERISKQYIQLGNANQIILDQHKVDRHTQSDRDRVFTK